MPTDDLTLERHFPHPIDRVFAAVTEPDQAGGWLPGGTPPWTPEPEETFEAAGASGRVTTVNPPQAFAWEWGTEAYRIDLVDDGAQTHLTLTHTFDDEKDTREQLLEEWERCLDALEEGLEEAAG